MGGITMFRFRGTPIEASIDYIASKRGSVAEMLGKTKTSSGQPESVARGEHAPQGEHAELEGQSALEAGHAALNGGQHGLSCNPHPLLIKVPPQTKTHTHTHKTC